MAAINRITDPELEQYIVEHVVLVGPDPLGVGAYGTVEEAQIHVPRTKVAAKKLHPALEEVPKWVSDFIAECKLMSQLDHPNIVQFIGICYLPGSDMPVLLMEKLQTNLDSFLETTPHIPLDVKMYLLSGTTQGVVYLHSQMPPLIHRDLTARNILLDSSLTAKIADLGTAKRVDIQTDQQAVMMSLGPGNNLYMPPEAVPMEGAAQYNTSIDIFSFGVVSVFTLTQTFPSELKEAIYSDPTTGRIIHRSQIERREDYIQQMKATVGDSHPLVNMTLDCLKDRPEDRPSAREVLRQLEEVERTVPQNCTQTKLELIQSIEQVRGEHQAQLTEKDRQLNQLQESNDQLQGTIDHFHLQVEQMERQYQAQLRHHQASVDRVLAANKRLEADREEKIQQTRREYKAQLSQKDGQISQLQAATTQLQSTVDLLQTANEYLQTEKEEIQHFQEEHQRQISEKDNQISLLQTSNSRLQAAIDRLKAEKSEQARGKNPRRAEVAISSHQAEEKDQISQTPRLKDISQPQGTTDNLHAEKKELSNKPQTNHPQAGIPTQNDRLQAEKKTERQGFDEDLLTHKYQLQMLAIKQFWGRP